MSKTKKIVGLLLSAIMVMTILIPSTVAHAAGTMAFSVGTDYGGLFGVDTSSDATNARDLYAIAGYSSYSSTQPTVSIMRGNFTNGTKRIQSDILFFSGHGNYDNVAFNYDGKGGDYMTGVYYGSDLDSTSGYKYVGLNGNMSSVKLVTFAACLTASNNDSNLAARAVNYGADTSVGWSSSVAAGSHSNWLARYNDKLATGSTVLEAVSYANSFTYLDSNVKDARIYGNRSQVIKLTKTASILDEEANMNKLSVSVPVVATVNGEITQETIIDAVSNNISEFDSTNYDVQIHEICDGCYTVDLVYYIGDVETNSCYTLTIVDNKIVSIIDNTVHFNMNEANAIISSLDLDSDSEVMAKARIATNSESIKEADDQTIKYYYDAETNSLKKVVFTTYFFDGTNAVGKDTYTVDVD